MLLIVELFKFTNKAIYKDLRRLKLTRIAYKLAMPNS
jgi:hypothetical protein